MKNLLEQLFRPTFAVTLILWFSFQANANTVLIEINDVSLPLELQGVVTLKDDQTNSLDTSLIIDSMEVSNKAQNKKIICSKGQNLDSKFKARGAIIVGFDKYLIRSICSYKLNTVEIFAKNNEGAIRFAGKIYRRGALKYRFSGLGYAELNNSKKTYVFDFVRN